jgi:D-3-phosphoglycerate dehydrogenase
MSSVEHPRIHLGPTHDRWLAQAIERGGGILVPLSEADAVVWAEGPQAFPGHLPASVRWVQVPSAGVESWIAAGLVDDGRTWTSAAGAYARGVAEHGGLLLLAGVRALPQQAPPAGARRSSTPWSGRCTAQPSP